MKQNVYLAHSEQTHIKLYHLYWMYSTMYESLRTMATQETSGDKGRTKKTLWEKKAISKHIRMSMQDSTCSSHDNYRKIFGMALR